MPVFYPRSVPRQLPLTPPDYVPSYSTNGCGGRQARDASYNVSLNMANRSDFVYEYPEQYGQQAALTSHPIPYQQTSSYNVALPTYPQAGHYLEPLGAPRLPPMRTQDYTTMDDTDLRQRQQEQRTRMEQQPKGEKAVGGVSAQLDYDMEQMTDYMSEMAQGMYDLFTSDICVADIDLIRSIQAGVAAPPQFRKWVSQVLCATRLPSATILLSLSYLSARMNMLSVGGPYKASEGQIYRLVTIALVLGSKFLDDNTFQNRSWSEVSGIKVAELNALEMEWLVAICFDLHRHPKEPQGFSSWLAHWLDYESRASIGLSRASQARSHDGSLQRNRSLHGQRSSSNYLTPEREQEMLRQQRQAVHVGIQSRHSYQPAKLVVPEFDYTRTSQRLQHQTPTYAPYDPWCPRLTEHSPASQPQTGPTTPDYYAGHRQWGTSEGYPGRNSFGFPPISHAVPPPSTVYNQPPFTPAFSDSCWSGHGYGCGCLYCPRQQPSYLMSHGYRMQTVAG